MKRSLPANAKISKEAKETVQECVSEFISFITGEASDKCQREKRKTINGDDLLWAMTTLGFENYVGPLKTYLNRYRETEGERGDDQLDEEVNLVNPSSSQAGSGSNPTEFSGAGGFYPAAGQGFGGSVVGYGINGGGGSVHGLRW
ncbi:nuclear transcription factor Y subunit B-11-like [Asparagus officinalis]|uniref:nuclear transcription factor Y subunit B-11-like n=1 Tax=Asparagus officinalis TaxID=4686 RepID=UPI00098E3C36|nr:nuclear transcription factor Y subunit B-11-like [Asparagus officinalis]